MPGVFRRASTEGDTGYDGEEQEREGDEWSSHMSTVHDSPTLRDERLALFEKDTGVLDVLALEREPRRKPWAWLCSNPKPARK